MAQNPSITLTLLNFFFFFFLGGYGGWEAAVTESKRKKKIQEFNFVNLQSSTSTLIKGFPEKVAATLSAHPYMQLSHQLEKISTAMPLFSQRFLLSRSISPWSCHRALRSNSSGLTLTFHAYPCGGRGSKTVNCLSSRMKTSFFWLTSCSHIRKPKCFYFPLL